MCTQTTFVGPAFVFDRGKKQPVSFSFRSSARTPLDLTGKTLTFRIGRPGSAAVYELALSSSVPTTGLAAATVDADVEPGSYEYHVDNVTDDRLLVRGQCEVRAVIGAAS